MPVEITNFQEGAPHDVGAPSFVGDGALRLHVLLRPHASLTPKGFVWFIGVTAALLALPLLALVGTPVLWGLLPFVLVAIIAVWAGLKLSWRDAELFEELWLWSDHLHLTHKAPGKAPLTFQANPYWTQLKIQPEGGKVPNYVTLRSETREVELGAFLSPEERRTLYDALDRDLRSG